VAEKFEGSVLKTIKTIALHCTESCSKELPCLVWMLCKWGEEVFIRREKIWDLDPLSFGWEENSERGRKKQGVL
jgi:hypothetical protein